MRYVSFVSADGPQAGVLEGDCVKPLAVADLVAYLELDPAARQALKLGPATALAEVALVAPLRPRKNVFCVGRNYLDHAAEVARSQGRTDLKLPAVPTFFTKAPTAIAGPGETLALSADISSEYDWEAELAVVIGRRVRDVSAREALDAVFGYACLNDLTARDLQRAHQQWFKGKSLDGTCPFGPWIVDARELGDPQDLTIELRVNGTVKQHSHTSKMIFPVGEIVAQLSRGMTLEPGDVIATGTPEGVGMARTPPEFLHDGDVVEIEIERIGVLRNTIRLERSAPA
ncbi:MAG: fumarylacetoacetate hydrolase family protein [Candidatus Baltobacteraceae bacterium]